jgi:hypothetical protein
MTNRQYCPACHGTIMEDDKCRVCGLRPEDYVAPEPADEEIAVDEPEDDDDRPTVEVAIRLPCGHDDDVRFEAYLGEPAEIICNECGVVLRLTVEDNGG